MIGSFQKQCWTTFSSSSVLANLAQMFKWKEYLYSGNIPSPYQPVFQIITRVSRTIAYRSGLHNIQRFISRNPSSWPLILKNNFTYISSKHCDSYGMYHIWVQTELLPIAKTVILEQKFFFPRWMWNIIYCCSKCCQTLYIKDGKVMSFDKML